MAFGGIATLAWIQRRDAMNQPAPGRLTSSAKRGVQMPSPWRDTSRQFNEVAWADMFGASLPLITKDQAMSIPGVARGRGIILSLLAGAPLVAYRGGARLPEQHAWLYRTPGWQGPWRRMANTLDDHIFYPWSLWGTKRGAAQAGLRPILEAWHIPYDDWEVDAFGRICVLDEDGHYVPADDQDVLLLPGPSEGLLAYATRTLAGAVELERAWVQRAKNPIPMIELHETVQSSMDETEAQDVVDAWAAARNSENGGIAYTPNTIEARALGQYSPDFFISGRNSSRLDIAAFLQLPGSLLDASTATASLTYVTQEGQASSLDQLTVPYYARPIDDRLSQDDVVPAGQIVRFSFTDAYTEPTGPIAGSSAGVTDAAVTPAPAPADQEGTTND